MADQERIKTRLDNIRSVEPILGAMRTISLGSWQAALNRRGRISGYSQQLNALLPALVPHMQMPKVVRRQGQRPRPEAMPILVVVVGSERGLCGAFNSGLSQYVEQLLALYEDRGIETALAALGSRAERALSRGGRPVSWSYPLPTTTLATPGMAHVLAHGWLQRYEAYEVDAVDLVYNAYRSSTLYEPTVSRLIPPPLPATARGKPPWPPPYIDTQPMALYAHLVSLWVTTEMYRILLDSAAAEHSARYQLMEGATQNSNRLIAELNQALQAARQDAITREMQDLAAGAGLLRGQDG